MNLSFFNRKKLPAITQDQIAECGLTSLTMIFKYHGLNVDLPSLRAKYPVSNQGSTLYDLIDICEHEGFMADAYEMEMEHFPELSLPAVLHWDLNHFVVLKSIKGNVFHIHDPAIGEIALPKEEFSKHFTGYALAIEPLHNDEFDVAKSAWDKAAKKTKLSLGYFVRKTRGFAKSFSFIMMMTFIAQLLSMAIPSITQVIIDDFIVSNTTQYMWLFIAGGIAIILFRYFADIIKSWSVIFVGYRWHANFSSYFFTRLLKLPIDYFDRRSVADIMSRFQALDELKEALTDRIVQGVIDGLMSIITITAMYLYSPTLATISLGFGITYFILRRFIVSIELNANRRLIMQKVKETGSFYDSVTNIQSVKIYGKEKERYQEWKKHYLASANESIRLAKAKMWYSASENLLAGIENIVLLGIGAMIVIQGNLSLGMMFAFFAYQIIFSTQSKSMVNNALDLKLLGVHLERLNDIEINDTENNLKGLPGIKSPIKGKIELKNISYRYPGTDIDVIDNFSLVIQPGENIVITGPSGCGKSTLLKLIMGLIEPTQGEILIDDIPLRTIGLQHYRGEIAAVSQRETLITGSVLDNITFFSKPIDMERVISSAKQAQIHDDIMLSPMQYQTLTGDIGNTFSGGQEQRILLARALYNIPKILFLDEATSFLDHDSEQAIVETIKDLNITRVSVAHRQETIDMAEREIKLTTKNHI